MEFVLDAGARRGRPGQDRNGQTDQAQQREGTGIARPTALELARVPAHRGGPYSAARWGVAMFDPIVPSIPSVCARSM